jgi:DNA-directed RNA polymerase subunit RPC12/RpoP
MVLLKDQIAHAELGLYRLRQRVKEQEQTIRELEMLRDRCDHKFTPPITGYEHEGGHCTHCGINELAAERTKVRYKFSNVFCSQCGNDFGPGNHGFSACKEHAGIRSIG